MGMGEQMIIPYKVDVPMQRWPIANFVLMGLTIVISLALFMPLAEWDESHSARGMMWRGIVGSTEEASPTIVDDFMLQPGHFRVTQLVGHLFLHADFFHLLGNMLFLFVFGNAVNAKMGHVGYLVIYFGAGLLEGCVWLLAGPGNPCLGASGAIMGIVGSFFMLYPQNDISVAYVFSWFWSGIWEISAVWVIAIYVAFDVWSLVRNSHTSVAYLSHIVGFGAGTTATAVILWYKYVEMDRNEKSLLQVWRLMPYDSDAPNRESRVQVGSQLRQPVTSASPVQTRKKTDDGPIPLD
jgi:membrane associated rhomboid family serine protease